MIHQALVQRRAITVEGIVQGVGFRPFVHQLARHCALCGFVRNRGGAVQIDVEGGPEALDAFTRRLVAEAPPLARVSRVRSRVRRPQGRVGFHIVGSAAGDGAAAAIPADVATCDACLAELFDPRDRRYRYPFINCTHCGPRLTIVRGAPYDRPRTTMAAFPMCAACRAEYDDPADRRFHAQPIACPACGPRLAFWTSGRRAAEGDAALQRFAALIAAGGIGALKGLGGYHLVCDARDSRAVRRLRARKAREAKPLAVMVASLAAAGALCRVDAGEAKMLCGRQRPIVLLERRAGADVADAVAPDDRLLGLMLPYTPLHFLLAAALPGAALVMTSGNRCDEPIAIDEPDAFERLGEIADAFLTHDRPIHVRCDDSVTRLIGGRAAPLRRSRGYAPEPIALPLACPEPILAVGGDLKSVFALGRERVALLSHHLGDLGHWPARQAFERDVALYERLFGAAPRALAHDLHPDYASTRYALHRAARDGLQAIGVQHHHAHLASCLAEHGLDAPVIGVVFDGTGYGPDGAAWGGEFLIGDLHEYRRAAHLRYVGMPGGDRAAREPWRMALAHLSDAGLTPDVLAARVPAQALRIVGQQLERRLNCPRTSSAGRLFDAVAALLGLRERSSYEAQAAMQLEALACEASPAAARPGPEFWRLCAGRALPRRVTATPRWPADSRPRTRRPRAPTSAIFGRARGDWPRSAEPLVVDTRPLIRAVVRDVADGVPPADTARRFHDALAEIICATCERLRAASGLSTVALSGGVFLNAVLTCAAEARLAAAGFRVLRQSLVPCGDGGLALGQLAVAARRLATPTAQDAAGRSQRPEAAARPEAAGQPKTAKRPDATKRSDAARRPDAAGQLSPDGRARTNAPTEGACHVPGDPGARA